LAPQGAIPRSAVGAARSAAGSLFTVEAE